MQIIQNGCWVSNAGKVDHGLDVSKTCAHTRCNRSLKTVTTSDTLLKLNHRAGPIRLYSESLAGFFLDPK